MVRQAHRGSWAAPAVAVVVLVVAAVLVVAVGAGLLLRELQPTLGTNGAAGGVDDLGGSTAPGAAQAGEPETLTVTLLPDVVAHPHAEQVRILLQNHFGAINRRDFTLWSRTVTAERAQVTTSEVWHDQYRSTWDSAVIVHRLEARPGGGLVALLSFTSQQRPVDAPGDLPVRCLQWRVSYPLVWQADELRLALAPPSTSLREPC